MMHKGNASGKHSEQHRERAMGREPGKTQHRKNTARNMQDNPDKLEHGMSEKGHQSKRKGGH
ncbi:MAG: hypothetical protein JO154_13960 [Chitinophaga sp.]|uniref:hypothetical protein n=1 Tax=Chitinophaga sp. TaxID=1869181 RepID=UPI0025BD135B|nr:hypothetical protein [Chitinophaga sp.]MBV8253709.1 hypothetical protein [Chitinophaga sp.]